MQYGTTFEGSFVYGPEVAIEVAAEDLCQPGLLYDPKAVGSALMQTGSGSRGHRTGEVQIGAPRISLGHRRFGLLILERAPYVVRREDGPPPGCGCTSVEAGASVGFPKEREEAQEAYRAWFPLNSQGADGTGEGVVVFV